MIKKDQLSAVVVGKGLDKKSLSTQQKEFNRLTEKIGQSKAQIELLNALGERMHKRSVLEMQPLLSQFQAQQAEMVRLFDRMLRQHKFNNPETRKLHQIITQMSFDLINAGFDDLKEIYNFYSPDEDFDAVTTEAADLTAAMMKDLANQMFGSDLDEDADIDTPEKLQAYIDQKMAERAQKSEEAKTRKAEKPKTAQQLKAEAKRAAQEEKRKLEEKKISQSVREVYMDLVKAFHPDREPDEDEKVRKTAILQRVTAAYEANDLLALLQLQLELERIDAEKLDTLADDKLRYFNKSLRSQLAELEEELWQLEAELAQMTNTPPLGYFNPQQLEREFEKRLKALKKDIKALKNELELMRDPKMLKIWLKGF